MSTTQQDRHSDSAPEPVELTREECLALLRSVPIGRLVHSEQALPAIRPLTFQLLADGVYVRTSRDGSILRPADSSAVVAFEADDYDLEGRYGWSVVVLGRASRVTDPLALARLAELPLVPWADGPRQEVVRISLELVSGRRVGGPVALPVQPRRPDA